MRVTLAANGVPYDVAFSLNDIDCLAHLIVIGQSKGGKWNWGRMEWDEPS